MLHVQIYTTVPYSELFVHATNFVLHYLIAGAVALISEKHSRTHQELGKNIANGGREILACYFLVRPPKFPRLRKRMR